jgi:hypothetical protein
MYRKMFLAALIAALACTMAFATSIEGKWKATFDTQMGTQNYTYEFHVDGNKVTGTATNDRGPAPIMATRSKIRALLKQAFNGCRPEI